MKRYAKVALALLVLGAVCLANPLYLGPILDATTGPGQVSQIYAGERVNPNTTAGQEQLARTYGGRLAFDADRLTISYLQDDYRAPNETYAVVTEAFANGSARVPNDAVRSDLRGLERNYSYLHNDSGRSYYRYRLVNRSGETYLNATAVTDSELTDAVLDRYLLRYDEMNASRQATVDRIVEESDADGYGGYRPYTNESLARDLPAVVLKDGTYYDVRAIGHVDDFGPGFLYFVLLMGAGVVFVVLGALVYVGGYVYERRFAD